MYIINVIPKYIKHVYGSFFLKSTDFKKNPQVTLSEFNETL